MTLDDLEKLETLERSATAAPWHVRQFDDDRAMTAVTVTTQVGNQSSAQYMTEIAGEIVAACFVQYPLYVMPDGDDEVEDRNAALIAATRNALPELLRLARQAMIHGL